MKSRRLTIYLLREEVQEFEDALDSERASASEELADSAGLEGKFYYVRPQPRIPGWVNFIQPVLAGPLDGIRSSSTSGLLLLRTSGRIFAITFGYGRSLLDLSKLDFQFGLRVALNRIDPRQIRSLDTKTFEDLVVSTNTQVSKSAELPTFGVDVSRDILRAVTGAPRDTGLATRLAGSDSLVMNLKVDPHDLSALCDDLLIAFHAEDYKADFGWIDQLALVRNSDEIAALNDLVVGQLRDGATGTTHLAMPETIAWEDVDAFKIGGTRSHAYDDLDLDEYLRVLGGSRQNITLESLKVRPVSVRFARSDAFDKRWNLYQCLVSEQRLDGGLYVLIESRWFAINETLVDEVDHFLSAFPDTQLRLIPARSGESEPHYNERLVQSAPGRLLKFDAKIKRPGGASSGIEFCDFLSEAGDIIHVKRKSRSSTLSHLFAQGSVSATTFLSDGHFRDQIRGIIEQEVDIGTRDTWLELVPNGGAVVERSRYSVIFAVVANSNRAGHDWLPFFSKLNLMQQGRQLINMGFGVSVVRVPIAE
ncbi:DUF6119 family protein [Zhihengliuella halotolerans]|uniref:DUF6119 family protein n=1 Tax=Zhihengliuella halotolerans TaxID=370736 RepID=UPI0011AF386F|nr:DUF6119 family protein [Zhihengliuella halotolerans]